MGRGARRPRAAPQLISFGPTSPCSFGRKHMHASISPDVSLAIVRAFSTLDTAAPTRLDVGKATVLCEVCTGPHAAPRSNP